MEGDPPVEGLSFPEGKEEGGTAGMVRGDPWAKDRANDQTGMERLLR